MICDVLYFMWADVWNVSCCIVCWLWYAVYFTGLGLLHCMLAVVWYMGCCIVCGLLNNMCVFIWF